MEKGENTANIAMKLEIANVVKRYSGDTNQSNGFWLMEEALKGTLTKEFWISEFEKDFPTKGEEIYARMIEFYKKTNIEQRTENQAKKLAKEIRKEARKKAKELECARYDEETKTWFVDNDYVDEFKKNHANLKEIGSGITYTKFVEESPK